MKNSPSASSATFGVYLCFVLTLPCFCSLAGELEGDFVPTGELALGYNNLNAESGDYEGLRHFTRIESGLYPQLADHFEHVFEDWVTTSVKERDREVG